MNTGEDERLVFFQSAIDMAREEFENDNQDTQALTRWGGALIEMAHLQKGTDSAALIDEGISKLQTAIDIDQSRHDAYWCLGNAYTSKGFMINGSREEAQKYFDLALDCFKKASELDPTNDIYSRAIDVTQKAPEIYDQIQRQMNNMSGSPDLGLNLDEGPSAGMMDTGFEVKKTKKSKSEDFWWDVAGWVCLLGIGIVILSASQKSAPLK